MICCRPEILLKNIINVSLHIDFYGWPGQMCLQFHENMTLGAPSGHIWNNMTKRNLRKIWMKVFNVPCCDFLRVSLVPTAVVRHTKKHDKGHCIASSTSFSSCVLYLHHDSSYYNIITPLLHQFSWFVYLFTRSVTFTCHIACFVGASNWSPCDEAACHVGTSHWFTWHIFSFVHHNQHVVYCQLYSMVRFHPLAWITSSIVV